eukprot:scaffold3810_cov188-Prasinococcus_capsulatus_cf.AAC.1
MRRRWAARGRWLLAQAGCGRRAAAAGGARGVRRATTERDVKLAIVILAEDAQAEPPRVVGGSSPSSAVTRRLCPAVEGRHGGDILAAGEVGRRAREGEASARQATRPTSSSRRRGRPAGAGRMHGWMEQAGAGVVSDQGQVGYISDPP